MNGSSVTTNGSQLYSGAVTLGTDNLLTSNTGNISFGSTVDSLNSNTLDNLTLTASGISTFNASVGGTNALNNLTVTNAMKLNGGSVMTNGNQLYSGAVTLSTDNVLSASAGTIGFASTVDSFSTTPESLTLTASGLSTFNGSVGGVHKLNSITITNAALLNGASISTSGNQTL